jgi:hypothetical protein
MTPDEFAELQREMREHAAEQTELLRSIRTELRTITWGAFALLLVLWFTTR